MLVKMEGREGGNLHVSKDTCECLSQVLHCVLFTLPSNRSLRSSITSRGSRVCYIIGSYLRRSSNESFDVGCCLFHLLLNPWRSGSRRTSCDRWSLCRTSRCCRTSSLVRECFSSPCNSWHDAWSWWTLPVMTWIKSNVIDSGSKSIKGKKQIREKGIQERNRELLSSINYESSIIFQEVDHKLFTKWNLLCFKENLYMLGLS